MYTREGSLWAGDRTLMSTAVWAEGILIPQSSAMHTPWICHLPILLRVPVEDKRGPMANKKSPAYPTLLVFRGQALSKV